MAVSAQALDAGAIPDLERFCAAFSPSEGSRSKCLRELHARLSGFDDAAALPARLERLEGLARWLCVGPKPPAEAVASVEPPQSTRLALLVRVLQQVPEWRRRVSAIITSVLKETSALGLFCESGLPNPRGFGAETSDRIARRLFPTPEDQGELSELLARCFKTSRDAAWLGDLSPALSAAFAAELDQPWQPIRESLIDAMTVLATRVSSLGLGEDIRKRSPEGPVRDSPYFQLPHADLTALPPLIAECRRYLLVVHDKLEQYGVSVDVVYRMEVITKCLDRMEAVLPLLAPVEPMVRAHAATQLLAVLSAARVRDRSLRDVFGSNMRLLARKMIERVGVTGEHYITISRKQYWKMMASAAGGGVVTVFTTILKFMVKWGHYAPFMEGMLSSTNYAASFVLMQLCGFTLATKQPSMTAAAIAGSLRSSADGKHDMNDTVTMIARICRSQLAAGIGNVLAVIPCAIGFNYLYLSIKGHMFMDAVTAEHTIMSFHATKSGTVPYAALTGVLLWLSSLGAGWLENWAVYRRLPEAIAQHRLKRVFGVRFMGWLSRFFAANIAGFGGNVAAGFLLGMTPVMGKFFGLPLDIRHVTLSAGSLAFAVSSIGLRHASDHIVLMGALGIFFMLILNFSVSFFLALAVALRAREVPNRERLKLLVMVIKRAVLHPFEFIYPPKRENAAATAAAHH